MRRARAALAASLAVTAGLVLPAAPAGANASTSVARIAGADRYDTAARVALAAFTSSNTVVIASGENFPDGLAAAGLAGAYAAPVLLTPSAALPSYTVSALAQLGAQRVLVVGGTAAVSDNVMSQLSNLGYRASRVAGSDRYDTAARVAAAMVNAVPVGSFNGKKTAFLASGMAFPDALSAGAPAFALHLPILLTDPQALSSAASSELTSLGVNQVIIMGGTGAVSAAVESSIDALPSVSTVRIAGTDRFDTAAKLATLELAPPVPGPTFNFAAIQAALPAAARGYVELVSGLNFPDAEAVGPRAARLGAPVVLDDPLPASSAGVLSANATNIAVVEAVGGESAVPGTDLAAAQSAASPSGGTATISALAGETAFNVAISGDVDPNTEVKNAFTVNNAKLPAGASCTAVETLVCVGLGAPLKGGDLIAMVPGVITDKKGNPIDTASFTVPNATAPTVTATQLVVGGTDFNVTFSRPIATSTPCATSSGCGSLNSTTVVLSGGQAIDFTKQTTNAGSALVPSATPNPTSFSFKASSPISSGETLTLTTGITDNSPTAIAMSQQVVVTASPDNTTPTPSSTTHQAVSQLSSAASGAVGGIALTAKTATIADGVNGNNFFIKVTTSGLNESTIVVSNSNCSASSPGQYCVTIDTGGLSGSSLTNALASDGTFSSILIGTAGSSITSSGPTALSGGSTAVGAVLILNKPLDTNSTPSLGSYGLDVLGDGNQTNATFFTVQAVDNGAAPTILVAIFLLKASAPALTPSTKLNVLTAPVDFAGHPLTPSTIAIS